MWRGAHATQLSSLGSLIRRNDLNRLQIELEREAKEAVSREKSLVERSLEAEQALAEAMRKVGQGKVLGVWCGLGVQGSVWAQALG